MFAALERSERTGILAVSVVVTAAGGLCGGITAALAYAVSTVMYMYIDPGKCFECIFDVWPAFTAGMVCGVVAGVVWTSLFISALLECRVRSGSLPSTPLAAGNAAVHGLLAGLLFVLIFMSWSLGRYTAIGPLTAVILLVFTTVEWLTIGLLGGTFMRLVMKRR